MVITWRTSTDTTIRFISEIGTEAHLVVTSWGEGRLDVFAIGTGNTLHHNAFDADVGQGWSGWKNLVGPADPRLIGVCSWAANRLDVFGIGPEDANSDCFHIGWAPGGGWSDIDIRSGMFMSPISCVSSKVNHLDIFGVSPESTVMHMWYP